MPLLNLDLKALREARAGLARQRSDQRSGAAEHAQAQAELQRLKRSGAGEREIARQTAVLARLGEAVRGSERSARASLDAIARLSETLRNGRNPADHSVIGAAEAGGIDRQALRP